MLRIRRKDSLFLFAGCTLIFLFVYLIINYSILTEENKPNFEVIHTKLDKLEKGLQQHGAEMHYLKYRLEKSLVTKDKIHNGKSTILTTDIFDVFDIKIPSKAVCEINLQQSPNPDIQMLNLYNELPFNNIDGGVWKQGWDIVYDPHQYNDFHKLNVFVVPHSHNDPGWLETFTAYYKKSTKHILSNALRHLQLKGDMKMIWAEISYFEKFYTDLAAPSKEVMKRLIKNGQFEFVTGGWVMPDEANSHWYSVLLQLTEGQTWLKDTFNITPISSWSIDPFGHSPTLPYILQKSGFQNLLIQRTHYEVKKRLALKQELEFYWRQLWDDTGSTQLFTHMMPFYSYDIPHTCGPDPKICCQFDFKRIAGFGLYCPWKVAPQKITEQNVKERATVLVDQWKKKAELYRTNALLVPLGDDFRYSQSSEWESQQSNYEQLFNYINSEPKYNVEAKFGTLQEYFDAVRKETKYSYPTLSGDFFTYADREDNYWSGYFTSRPYHKRMDRLLLHYVRSAEMLGAYNSWPNTNEFGDLLQNARRELSLFQHHDGITGTAKPHVMSDYLTRMVNAVTSCQYVMQQSVYRLMTKPSEYFAEPNYQYFTLDDSRWPGPDKSRTTIILGDELPSKHVVFHNSLSRWREELVDFYVSTPYVKVTNLIGEPLQAQVNPVWNWHHDKSSHTVTPQAATTKYRLIFKVKIPPLGLITNIIKLVPSTELNKYTFVASNLILSETPISVSFGESYPEKAQFGEHREFDLRMSDGPMVAFSKNGFLKSIKLEENGLHTPVHLNFYKYESRTEKGRSGAYLFLPNGEATPFDNLNSPVVLVIKGPLESSVSVGLTFVVHQTLLHGNSIELRNLIDIGIMEDTEIAMRISTHIKNNNIFYTDLNGLQMIKRKYFSKVTLQGNYYPVASAIYIEDSTMRLTVVTGQPLGGTSLKMGELEIMQDRRLKYGDERGLGEGVVDNQPVLHVFRILLENISACKRPIESHPSGLLTLPAHLASKDILNPVNKFIFTNNDWSGVQSSFGETHEAAEDDTEIVAMRNLNSTKNRGVSQNSKLRTTGIIVHRTNILECPTSDSVRTGNLNLMKLIPIKQNITAMHNTTLTFLKRFSKIHVKLPVTLCPMDTKAFTIQHYS